MFGLGYTPAVWGSVFRVSGASYDPVTDLGTDLIELWLADRSDLITVDGSNLVAAWNGVKNGYSAVQATGTAKPVWGATSFNGSPGVTFDGSDDQVSATDAGLLAALPAGATASWLWVVTQDDATTGGKYALSYGNTTITSRQVGASTASRRPTGQVGDGAAAQTITGTAGVTTGRHVLRLEVGATSTALYFNGTADPATPLSVVPSTSVSRLRMGALPGGGGFWQGVVRAAAVTLPLTDTKRDAFASYLDGLRNP